MRFENGALFKRLPYQTTPLFAEVLSDDVPIIVQRFGYRITKIIGKLAELKCERGDELLCIALVPLAAGEEKASR